MSDSAGVLYIVATPIGNLADISQRALDVLQDVDLIVAEDTRNSQKLLGHYAIKTRMMALHEHNEREQADELIKKLQAGTSIAAIIDAGTPLISDPGYHLVSLSHEHGIRVVPIPGPSALITALSTGGLATDRFVFEGFLPSKAAARLSHLQTLAKEPRTMVFYEAPHRLIESLESMLSVFGADRMAVLARELTKLYETVRRASLEELCDWVKQNPEQQKGESVILVAGCASNESTETIEIDVDQLLTALLTKLHVKEAAQLASQISGLSKNRLYARALELQQSRRD